jgi:hypothetical protein
MLHIKNKPDFFTGRACLLNIKSENVKNEG